jgi:hypothetical protein
MRIAETQFNLSSAHYSDVTHYVFHLHTHPPYLPLASHRLCRHVDDHSNGDGGGGVVRAGGCIRIGDILVLFVLESVRDGRVR